MNSAKLDPLSVIIPVLPGQDPGERVRRWHAVLADREAEIILIDDGRTPPLTLDRSPESSSESTAELSPESSSNLGASSESTSKASQNSVPEPSPESRSRSALESLGNTVAVRVVRHEYPRGLGACLTTALAVSRFPTIVVNTLDYPYDPADLSKLLARLGEPVDVYGTLREIEVINGCRTGRPTPAVWALCGWCYRAFCRVVLSMPLDPAPSWLGLGEHVRNWFLWLVMAVPLNDPQSGFKVMRKSVLDRMPIQSEGPFVLTELIAKMTFLTVIMDEVPLSPSVVPPAKFRWWDDFRVLLGDARFRTPEPKWITTSPVIATDAHMPPRDGSSSGTSAVAAASADGAPQAAAVGESASSSVSASS